MSVWGTALLSENFGTAVCWVVMSIPTKATSDRNNKSKELDEGKLAYILCRNLAPVTEPKLMGDRGWRSRCHLRE